MCDVTHSNVFVWNKKNLASSIQDNTCTFAEGGKSVGETVLDTFTHCNALQCTTTHCNALQQHMWLEQHMSVLDTFTHCNAMQRTAITRVIRTHMSILDTFTHCNALQHTATHCNALQRTAITREIRTTHVYIRCIYTLQRTATHCKHCNNTCD